MSIDLEATGTACIAFATGEHNGSARWTELSVYRLPDGKFLSQVQGKSSISGERTKTQRLASTSLERVLKLFADSDIGVVAAETAREWAEQHELAEDAAAMRRTAPLEPEHPHGQERRKSVGWGKGV